MKSKIYAVWLVVGLLPISAAVAQSDFESSKLSSGTVVQGAAMQSSKLTSGVVLQNATMQSSKLSSGVVLQNAAFSSPKLSVGIVVQVRPMGGVVPRAPLVHW